MPEGEPQYPIPPQQPMNQQGQHRPPMNQGPHYNGGFHPGMRQQILPGQSPQMVQQQGMGYSPRSSSATQHIPMGPGSNRSAGSSVDTYPPPLQRPGPPGTGPPHASVRMVSHPNNNPNLPQQHVLPPGMHPGMRMQHPQGNNPGMRRPSSSTSDMYNPQPHPQMIQPQRSASTIPYPSPSASQGINLFFLS